MKKILVQLDPDTQPSLFDAVVAIDCSVDELLQYDSVEAADVRDIVHAAIFTRARKHLHNTAIFVGGRDVKRGEALLEEIRDTFFGPMRVSVMLDSNGANTTAAAAVLAAAGHLPLEEISATVLAGTGPVGQRACRLLIGAGSEVRVCSRKLDRAKASVERIQNAASDATGALIACETRTPDQAAAAVAGAELIIAAGAAGIALLPAAVQQQAAALKVAIDLNAVAPHGIESIDVTDKAEQRGGVICYGAIGVGGLKMTIHRAAIEQLFSTNDLVLDAEQIFALGQSLTSRDAN